MEKFRLGVVGCGGIMAPHIKAIVEACEEVEISAVCDIIEERAQKVADAVGGNPYVTTDWKTMPEHVEGVLIALPHDLHYECGLFFARHKVHLLMEKPICNTEEECVRLIDVCDEEGVIFMCGYVPPYKPGLIKLKEMIDSGEYGKPFMMSHWTEQYTRPEDECSWIRTARVGGGQLFSHGCHHIDVLLRFLGRPVSGAHFGTNLGTPWMLKEGSSMVAIKFESGAIGYHGATWGARGTRMGYDTQIHCEKGMIEYDAYAGVIKVYDNEREHIPGEPEKPRGTRIVWDINRTGNQKYFDVQTRHFIECCRTGKRPITDARASLQSLRVIWKLYEAEKQGIVADLRGLGLEDAYNEA